MIKNKCTCSANIESAISKIEAIANETVDLIMKEHSNVTLDQARDAFLMSLIKSFGGEVVGEIPLKPIVVEEH